MKFSEHLAEIAGREPGQRAPRRRLELNGPGDPPGDLRAAAATVLDNRGLVYAPRWQLRQSARRSTVGLDVDRGAVLTVTCPAGITGGQLAAELRRHARRITRQVTAAEAALPEPQVKDLAAGEGFPWLGLPHRLRVTFEPDGAARRGRDGFGRHLLLPAGLLDPRHGGGPARDAIIAMYTADGTAWARREAEQWLPRLGLAASPPSTGVADLGAGRWYEYRARRHEVRLHWAVFQLDTELVRCLLVHALVHATRPAGSAHGPEFRRRLDRVMPLRWKPERRLAEQIRTLWTGDVRL